MVFGGVFERHPNLTVLVSELGIDWFPGWVSKVDSMAAPGVSPLVVGEYRWPLTPREYVERNVRISPIPAAHESPLALMEQMPGVAVFSSDYPHYEGNPNPLAYYDQELTPVEDASRAQFFGGSIAESYARMGDPASERGTTMIEPGADTGSRRPVVVELRRRQLRRPRVAAHRGRTFLVPH